MPTVAISDLDRVAFCDPAGGKRGKELKRTSARAAIVVIGQDSIGHVFVLQVLVSRHSTDELIEQILQISERWRPRVFGIEANAMQVLFADAVRREARHRERALPLLPVQQSTKVDKTWRIRTALQPLIGDGRLFLQPQQHDLWAEITTFPMNPLVDCVDALASAVTLLRPITGASLETKERNDLAAYLRKIGASPQTIERELRRRPGEKTLAFSRPR